MSFKIDKLTPSNYPVWKCVTESILLKAGVEIIKMSGYAIIRTGVTREIIPLRKKRCCENVDYIRESICCN